ncbi:MAG: class I SAM-dependent methyltransferase [Lachnospiraceae bacterium]|jgi:SAM-dependent methyltransferase|nr:class I SAM-dependent methyltransferase [Lachnospiraceae bacterium]
MNIYQDFAKVYDLFMDDIPYDEWAQRILISLMHRGIVKGRLADLACGTGSMTRALSLYGFDMIGVDSSKEMLSVAYDINLKEMQSGEDDENIPQNNKGRIVLIQQDLRSLRFDSPVDAAICVCDSINYITPEELVKVFASVKSIIRPGGAFLFDFNTDYNYRKIIGDGTIAEVRDVASFIWENEYNVFKHENHAHLTFFVEAENELYRRFEEDHIQYGYRCRDINAALESVGFKDIVFYDDYTEAEALEDSERVYTEAFV